ncbi:MAG: type II toxin-antitoxin system HicA family toxin [Defluviitaleaceae bacterium]|nr:type II toxin-antitoxin system HicA family toxin [Defluviitaleaceae bacterium]
MSKKDKMMKRLKSRPKDFTFDEAVALLLSFGLTKSNKGKTSGSRISFIKGNLKINLHKPHPRNILKMYQVDDLLSKLEEEGLI